MSVINIESINISPNTLEGLVSRSSASMLSQTTKPTDAQIDEVKQTAESKLKKDTDTTKANLNSDELKHISERLQRMFNSDLIFSVDEKSGEHVIQVIDRSTKEVIRQIPSEEAIRIKESIDRFQKGLLVNIKT